MKKNSIFLCHSSKDKKFVEKLSKDLLSYGINVWFDKWEIRVGDSIISKINSGIIESSFMGVILSPNSVKSNWVQREINAGLIKEINKKEVVILPILYKSCSPPPLLSDKKYANFTVDYKNGMSELLDVFNIKQQQKGEKLPETGHLIIDNTIDNTYHDNVIDNVFEGK